MRASSRDKGEAERVCVVTTAGLSHTDDRRLRQRRYAITQAVRVCCFVLAVLLPVPMGVKLVLLVAALLLPLMGVVAANAGPVVARKKRATAIVDPPVASPDLPGRFAIDPGRVVEAER